ncbi:hypothetical protein HPB49_007166 [Dermacentor silvarum]|uniref:Uncharacterized protein n=1 Tax=Dermacentor silvarum TaxID=543639 RepID=A0ACB8CW13_DERSI|nr:hypothetical protein HPB49_007166 [Dermacentor silvarum]
MTVPLGVGRPSVVQTSKQHIAVRVVKCSDRQCTDGLRTRLRWFPAHQGCYFGSTSPNRNETANAAARGLTRRVVAPASLVLAEGVATDDEDDEEEAELVTSYADVLEWYRSARRSMPDPHPQLTREQAVLYRQLQTNSVLTPALARFICPDVYESSKCSVCNSATATLTHVLWDCKLNTEEAAAYPGRLPTDIARAVTAQDSEQQLQAVQRIETALARQTRRDAPDGTQTSELRLHAQLRAALPYPHLVRSRQTPGAASRVLDSAAADFSTQVRAPFSIWCLVGQLGTAWPYYMSRPSYRGVGPGQSVLLDQQCSAGCSSSHSGGKFERTDDANYAGTHSYTEIPSAHAQPSAARGPRRFRLSISDRFVKGDDGPSTSDRPAIALELAPRPTTTKRHFAASGMSARHCAPHGLNADSMRIPPEPCDMPNTATAFNIGSRSRRRAVVDSSESEAEAIAVCHSKWVTFVTPISRASQEIEERGRKDDCHESSGVLECTRSRCVESTDGIDKGSNTIRTEGLGLQHLSSTRHLDLSHLIEAASAQLARAGNTARGWSALEFVDDQPRPEPLEEKLAAWDPCQADSYALSPPGELELFELDMFDARRTRRPKPAPRKVALCRASKSSCPRSPTSPAKSKKLLPVTAADSTVHEDLHWFIESCEQSATSPQLCDRATTAASSTPKAEARAACRYTKACWATKRQACKAFALPSTKPRSTTSTGRREDVSPYAPKPSKSDFLDDLNSMSAEESRHVVLPVASGIEEDKPKEGDAKSDEPDEQEAAARREKKHHHKRDRKKRH